MAMTARELESIALLEATDGRSELYDGELREKPPMSVSHNWSAFLLTGQLFDQVDRCRYQIRTDAGFAAVPAGNYYIPDISVIPIAMVQEAAAKTPRLEHYRDPLPFVVEIWSPSAGRYDIDAKNPGYRERGDAEIWRLHPEERTLRMWRRQPDGSYAEKLLRGGKVRLHGLPNVTIDLDEVFGAG